MNDLAKFYLSSRSSIVRLECLELSHSSFSQTYRAVRNAVHGVTVTHEDASEHFYGYIPMRLEMSGPSDDLDFAVKITLGDLGEIVPMELDRVRAENARTEMPVVTYRCYRSDDLSKPLFGPLVLLVDQFTMNRQGCSFDARAPSLSVSGTGERYSIARFPMLRGLLR